MNSWLGIFETVYNGAFIRGWKKDWILGMAMIDFGFYFDVFGEVR